MDFFSQTALPHILFNATATTDFYPLSLHNALPIYGHDPRSRGDRALPALVAEMGALRRRSARGAAAAARRTARERRVRDRKSTRLNSSHANISYAVFCLKKKNRRDEHTYRRHR